MCYPGIVIYPVNSIFHPLRNRSPRQYIAHGRLGGECTKRALKLVDRKRKVKQRISFEGHKGKGFRFPSIVFRRSQFSTSSYWTTEQLSRNFTTLAESYYDFSGFFYAAVTEKPLVFRHWKNIRPLSAQLMHFETQWRSARYRSDRENIIA